MNWMFLDAPPDGSVMLVWQPLNKMGTRFASDGYVWADAEQVLRHPHQGYVYWMPPRGNISVADNCTRWWKCIFTRVDTDHHMSPCQPTADADTD